MEVGDFDVVGEWSGGRYGARWRARDRGTGEPVVLKQVTVDDPLRRERLVSAQRELAALRHENLARTYPPVVGPEVWLVEEMVDGASLAALTARQSLSSGQALAVVRGMLSGLAEAHRHGQVHGTVAPATVMITPTGDPKLIELGAWHADPAIAGLGGYASPEAVAGGELGFRADVFSAGAVATGLLTDALAGRPDGDLARVLGRATADDPAARQADAGILLDELSRAAERTYGALWWTTEGLGAAAAAAGGGAAASGAGGGLGAVAGTGGGSSGLGALAGSLTESSPGALTSSGAPAAAGVVAGAAKVAGRSRRWKAIAIGAGAAVLVAAVVTTFAVTRPRTIEAGPAAAGNQPTSAATTTAARTPSPTPTPTPRPREAGFSGTYAYVETVTKSNWAGARVGQASKATWTVTTACRGTTCTSTIKSKPGTSRSATLKAGGWDRTVDSKAECVDTKTGRPQGYRVTMRYTRALKISAADPQRVRGLAGTSRYRQLKPCHRQAGPLVDVRYKVTVSYTKG